MEFKGQMKKVNIWPAVKKKGSTHVFPQATGKAVLSTGNINFHE